ncbi:hypothetical protein GCM10010214_11590 [Streptomyces abikoensis]|nr:hypothetical protein GCM10010214_11590 [Streptomyces abikoensis]
MPTDLMPGKLVETSRLSRASPLGAGFGAAGLPPGGIARPEGAVAEATRSGVQKRRASSTDQLPEVPEGAGTSDSAGLPDGPEVPGVGDVDGPAATAAAPEPSARTDPKVTAATRQRMREVRKEKNSVRRNEERS